MRAREDGRGKPTERVGMETVMAYHGGHRGDRCIPCSEEETGGRKQRTVNSTGVFCRHTKAGTEGFQYSDSRPVLKQQEKRGVLQNHQIS